MADKEKKAKDLAAKKAAEQAKKLADKKKLEAEKLKKIQFDDLTKVSFQFKKGLYFHLDFDPDDLPKSIKESIKSYLDNKESENNNRIEQLKKELDGL